MSFIDVGQSPNDGTGDSLRAAFQKVNELLSRSVLVVEAGEDLQAPRPEGAACVYWRFDSGVDIGTDGTNIENAVLGDLFYVAPGEGEG